MHLQEDVLVRVHSLTFKECVNSLITSESQTNDFHQRLNQEEHLLAESTEHLRQEGAAFRQQVYTAQEEFNAVKTELEAAVHTASAKAALESQELQAEKDHLTQESQQYKAEMSELASTRRNLVQQKQSQDAEIQLQKQKVSLQEQHIHNDEASAAAASHQRDLAERELIEVRASTWSLQMRADTLRHQELFQANQLHTMKVTAREEADAQVQCQ